MASKLLARTIELLKANRLIPLARIAREVDCHPSTLRGMMEGKNVPSVELCESIYNLLSRDPLEVK